VLLHQYLLICLFYSVINPTEALWILTQNSISDIIQYCTAKFVKERTVMFPEVSTKCLEGYQAGLIVTPAVMTLLFHGVQEWFSFQWVMLNLLGMLGGVLNSYTKRKLELKDWSGIFGSHGGLNDRLDSWLLPCVVLGATRQLENLVR
jgi:predicted CDP-diglyceride synthetase/phosphatidate cytidylyltransferase